MGLSSKQVSCNGLQLDWEKTLLQVGALELPNPPQVKVRHQQQQQQQEPLNCPRCDSTNTKFCYYNNYNRSQPRHFCKTCRRHWTKGGTLRNVPVGGGRKNKRVKTAKTSTTINNQVNHHGCDTNIEIQSRQQFQHLPFALGDSKNISEMVYRALLHTPSSLPPSLHPDSSINSNNNSFLDSTLSLPLPSISEFPFTSSISFDNASSSVTASFSPSEGYNYGGETETVVDPVITSSGITPQWQLPTSNNFLDSTSTWNWDDFATLVSTDLKQTWDEFGDKPNGK